MPGQPQPYAKVAFFFEDGKYGWQEVLYIAGATNGIKLNPFSVLPKAVKLGNLRGKMLAGGNCAGQSTSQCQTTPSLTYIRVSQVGLPRNNAIWDPQSGYLTTGPGLPAIPATANALYGYNKAMLSLSPSAPYDAIEYNGTMANGLTFHRTISGGPSADICDQMLTKGSVLATAFSEWAKQLVADGWGLMSSSIVANGASTAGAIKISGITPNGDSFCRPLVALPSALTFPLTPGGLPANCQNNYVQIFCYKPQRGFPNLNGIYRMSYTYGSSGPNLNEVLLYRSPKCFEYIDPGYIVPYNGPTFSLITSLALNKPVLKKRGSPFGRPRGRAPSIR